MMCDHVRYLVEFAILYGAMFHFQPNSSNVFRDNCSSNCVFPVNEFKSFEEYWSRICETLRDGMHRGKILR